MTKWNMPRLEGKREPLVSRRVFAERMAKTLGIVAAFVLASLAVGMAGYHYTEDLPWIDSFANASMILSGMGPLDTPNTYTGKLFSGCYALYSGLAVLIFAAVLLTPVIHRMFHRFHLEEDGKP